MRSCINFKTRNAIHLGLGFMCVFFAFNSQGFIEQTVIDAAAKTGQVNSKAGYYSLAIIYALAMATNLVVAPAIDFLGPRWSMLGGGLLYTVFLIGFLFLNEPYLYITSATLGIGSAFLWTGQGKYLTMNSTTKTAGRNSGMFWGMLQTSLLLGGIFLFAIFKGIGEGEEIDKNLRMILYGVFAAVCLVGNIILGLVPLAGLVEEKEGEHLSQWQILSSAFRLVFTRNMALLVIVFLYTGLELSYWSGVYPTCISFSKRLEYDTHQLIALNAICQGVGQIIGGLCFGIMGDKFKRFGRNPIVLAGYLAHIVCFVLSFINFPFVSTLEESMEDGYIKPSIALALVVGGILGFGDACWNTQVISLLMEVYHTQPSQAFSILKFAQSAAACAAFFYSAELELQWVLLILVITSTLSLVAFFIVEISSRRAAAKAEKEKKAQNIGATTIKTINDDEKGVDNPALDATDSRTSSEDAA